jgi:hypothetical protein
MSADRLVRLATEVLGDAADVTVDETAGITTARATAGKVSRSVQVGSSPVAEAEARERLFRLLLDEHGRAERGREWRAKLEDARDRGDGRHVHAAPRPFRREREVAAAARGNEAQRQPEEADDSAPGGIYRCRPDPEKIAQRAEDH